MAFQYDSRSEVVWLNKHDRLPDTCCSCGMFSDNRVTVKHVEEKTELGKSGGGVMMILTLIMHVALGPLGWLLAALLEGREDPNATKTVKKKSKIRITQCTMCHATEPPEIVESSGSSFSLLVHPLFKTKLAQARRMDEEG